MKKASRANGRKIILSLAFCMFPVNIDELLNIYNMQIYMSFLNRKNNSFISQINNVERVNSHSFH